MEEATATAPAASSEKIRHYLDGEYRSLRERIRTLLAGPDLNRPPLPIPAEDYRELVFEWAKRAAERGETGLGFPEKYGGKGDIAGSIVAFETMALGDLSLLVKCGVQFGLFGGAVLHLGTERHHEAYIADIVSLELPGAFAMTETGHGSDVQSIGTTATYDSEAQEFIVNTPDDRARKDYIGNAAEHGRIAAVFAQLIVGGVNHGVHCLLVPLRDKRGRLEKGVRIEDCGHKVGLNGVDNGRIWFDEVRVPREALLDRYAQVGADGLYTSEIDNPNRRFFTMLGTLIQGRISVSAGSISAVKVAQTIAIRHADRRRQFGPPDSEEEVLLIDYLAHQRRLFPGLAKTYALYFAQQELIAQLDEAFTTDDYPEQERRELEARAAGVKAMATWHATETIQLCREACGGAGYMTVNRLGELRDDVDVFTTFEGDNTVLLQLVAKGLLTDYRDEFGALDPFGTVGFVIGQVYETVVERSAVREIVQRVVDDLVPGRDDDPEQIDRESLLDLLRWREEHMIGAVARRLKGGIDQGFDQFTVFNHCQDHVIATARTHTERQIAEAFSRAVEACEDPGVKQVLERLFALYALTTIEADRGWFQEHGRISSTRAKALTRHVNQLLRDLRPDAVTLVDAFGIPDELIAAPIGLKDA